MKKILWAVSSVGKGHVTRDLAIISQIQKREQIDIEWIAPYPIADYLKNHGQRVLGCSEKISGSGRIYESIFRNSSRDFNLFKYISADSKLHKHDFDISMDVIDSTTYDLLVGDEAFWLLSGFGSNLNKKRIPFIFMTDFIGMTVMRPSIYDYMVCWWKNFQFSMSYMIPDQYIYIGCKQEIPNVRLGLFLPNKRKWAEKHCTFVKPIVPFDDKEMLSKERLQEELKFDKDKRLFISVIGPEGDYAKRLQKIEEVFRIFRSKYPDSIFIIVSPSIGDVEWISYHKHLENLYKYFAISDFAIVQSGYGKVIELSALGIPFIAVPLDYHFEQEYVMKHRISYYSTGKIVTFRNHSAKDIADIALELIGQERNKIEIDNGVEVAKIILNKLHLTT